LFIAKNNTTDFGDEGTLSLGGAAVGEIYDAGFNYPNNFHFTKWGVGKSEPFQDFEDYSLMQTSFKHSCPYYKLQSVDIGASSWSGLGAYADSLLRMDLKFSPITTYTPDAAMDSDTARELIFWAEAYMGDI